LIIGARVIDPASGLDSTMDIAIGPDGRIAAIGQGLPKPSDPASIIDAGGLIATPGLIDPHVHLREPGGEHKETIASGTRAALSGGFTTVCCMPNTMPTLDSPEVLSDLAGRIARTALCRVFPVAAGTFGRKGEQPAPIAALAHAGAVGISDDGDAIASDSMMLAVLSATQAAGLAFMQHCQDPATTVGASMHDGEVAVRLGLIGWPRSAEESILERDLKLVAQTGCRYHAQHLSSGGSVEILRRARAAGLPASGEVSPHHLILTHEACDGFDTSAKMNPPLRETADIAALRQGVADGVITVLATDHAPHAAHEKAQPFEDAPFGIIGLETALPLYAEALVHSGAIDWPRLIAMMTIEPARLCGLDRLGLGQLAIGAPADITLIDPEHAWIFDATQVAGLSANSPFLGRSLRGRAVMAIVGGRVVLDRLNRSA
jgi:dihydroorotase